MAGVGTGTVREQVIRWMEDGGAALETLRGMLHESSQFKLVAEAAQTECERLRHEVEQLRAEVKRLTAEIEHLQRERAEAAQWFAATMTEAAARLRSEPSSGASGGSQ